MSANKALSHIATNSQQPLSAPRSSLELATNLSSGRPSVSQSFNRALSHSPTSSQQLLPALIRPQDFTASNTSMPSTSLSANRALEHSPTSPQQPLPALKSSQGGTSFTSSQQQFLAPFRSHHLTYNPSRLNASVTANRALAHPPTSSQKPLPLLSTNLVGSSDAFTVRMLSKKMQRDYSKESKTYLIL